MVAKKKRAGRAPKKNPAPSTAPTQAPSLLLELSEVDFRDSIGLRKGEGKQLEQTRHVGMTSPNKHSVTRLWTDGFFVYIQSEKYLPRAVPCSNVLSVYPVSLATNRLAALAKVALQTLQEPPADGRPPDNVPPEGTGAVMEGNIGAPGSIQFGEASETDSATPTPL